MKGRKALLPVVFIFSALSALLGMLPYIFIWFIVRVLFTQGLDYSPLQVASYAWWALGTAVVSMLFYFLALTCSHLVAFRVEVNMRRYAMRRLSTMPLGFFDRMPSGRIRKIIDDNASTTHAFIAHQVPDLAGTILIPLLALVLILTFDWPLGLACLIPIAFSMALMKWMMGTRGQTFMKNYMTSLEEMNAEAVEYVRGIPVVKVFQQTVFSFKNFHKSIMLYRDMVVAYTNVWKRPMSAYTVMINGFVFFLVPVAILLMDGHEPYTSVMLNLLLYVLITPVFSVSIMRSMHLSQAWGQAHEAVDRLENLTDVAPLPEPVSPKMPTRYDVRFNQVSFRYPGVAKNVIEDISFTIPHGKTVALVGPSGGGKTTISRLLPRFWDADQGSICIGDIDVKDVPPAHLMNIISFVFQDTRLFKTSLLENIQYGNPAATREAVERAVDLAQCREIIDRLPQGLDTRIGIAGTYLSGGEQQRIALARAILKDAPIVVLDEATAFTDPENEYLIQTALGKLAQHKTVLMIAHRLTSVVDADCILVIHQGRIAEQGTHAQLLHAQGLYTHLWNEYQQAAQWKIKKEMNNA